MRARLGLIGACCVFVLLVARFDWVCDDAYISLRYARHLARGAGLCFNLGEAQPVEGYSNLLWVIVLAVFERLGLDAARWATLVSASCGLVLLVRALRFAERELALDALGVCVCGIALATLPPCFVWATGGLETMPFALALFLVFEGVAARESGIRCAALAACAAVLLRPDGVLWTLCAAGAALAACEREARRQTLRRAGIVAAAALAVALAQEGFRVLYHGDWIAQTVRIKGAISAERIVRGVQYLATQLLEVPLFGLAWLGALLLARRERIARAVLVVAGFACASAIGVGGDFMAFGRFLVPAAAFALLGWAALRARIGRGAWLGLSGAAIALSLASAFDRSPLPDSWRQALHFRHNEPLAKSEAQQWSAMKARAGEWLLVGRALARHAAPGESIVLSAIGASAYPNELFVYDTFGLVSRAVADVPARPAEASPGHDKRVPASFFLAERPTYLGAWIAPRGAPLEAGQVERLPLPDDGSFPPGVELRVIRNR